VTFRPAWAEVDLDAIAHNATRLREWAAPARLCAVVKADGYGHGAVPVARAALAGGADWLAVALVEEGVELREAGIDAPVLVLSEPPPEGWDEVVARRLRPAVYTRQGIAGLSAATRAIRATQADRSAAHQAVTLGVHLKVDTGMHRVGAPPHGVVALARAVDEAPGLELEGVWTHCAVADEPDDPFTALQIERFSAVLSDLHDAGFDPPIRHAANSAGAIAHPASRFDMVRCGIALYGVHPSAEVGHEVDLRPALRLVGQVSHVQRLPPGETVSYGRRFRTERDTTVATVAIGYADGVSRRLSAVGGEVLIGGVRRRIAGTVTMDQLMVDCGDDEIRVGDEVVLLGRQGAGRIAAEEWAERLDTIGYEVVCGIGPRVPRRYREGCPPCEQV
jgi:alanine racemase